MRLLTRWAQWFQGPTEAPGCSSGTQASAFCYLYMAVVTPEGLAALSGALRVKLPSPLVTPLWGLLVVCVAVWS